MPPPWSLLATTGVVILGLLYYISWTYLARVVCRRLLKGNVIFGSSKTPTQNGVEEKRYRPVVVDQALPSDSGSPRLVDHGMLAEIAQLYVSSSHMTDLRI